MMFSMTWPNINLPSKHIVGGFQWTDWWLTPTCQFLGRQVTAIGVWTIKSLVSKSWRMKDSILGQQKHDTSYLI